MTMRAIKSFGQLRSKVDHLFFRQRATAQLGVESHSRYVLRDQIIDTVIGTEVEDGFNIGMIEFGKRQSFSTKPPAANFVLQRAPRQDLQRNIPVQLFIASQVH